MNNPKQHLAIYGVYLLLAVMITFPAILTLSTHIIGGETGDNFEMARNIWWFVYAIKHGEPLYYQTLLGYPNGFSSILLAANQLQFLPAYVFAFLMPLAMAYNLTMLLTMALNGWAMFWLARYVLGREALVPSVLAGMVFMSAPTFQGHLFEGHAGLMVQWGLPLFIWSLLRLCQRSSVTWRDYALAIVFFNLTPSGHMLQVIYALMPTLGVFFLGLWWRNDWRGIQRVLVVCVLAGGFMLVFLAPMILDTLSTRSYTETGGTVRYSADLLSIVSPSFLHPLYANLGYNRQVLGVNLGESPAYLGVFVVVLMAIGLWRVRDTRWWLLLGGVAWVLSLGSLLKVLDQPILLDLGDYQTHLPLLWSALQDVTGFNLARTPARFDFVLAVAVAMLAGFGMREVWQWAEGRGLAVRLRYGGAVLLACGILFDVQFFFPMPTRSAQIPQAVYDLADEDIRAVFYMPYEHLLAAKDTLFLQTAHEKPLIAGQITRETPVNPAKLAILQNAFNPALLKAEGVDVVILHKDRAREMRQLEYYQSRLASFGAPRYEDERIAIYHVPNSTRDTSLYLVSTEGGTFERAYHTDFYTAQGGWFDLRAVLNANGRTVVLWLDNEPLHRWTLDGETEIRVSVPIERAGYYRLSLRLDPPCPAHYSPLLTCKGLTVGDVRVMASNQPVLTPFIGYEGVRLLNTAVQVRGDVALVRLLWRAESALTDQDIRFVHILDSNGRNIAQVDTPIGTLKAGELWSELVRVPLESLEEGIYSVRVGWYRYPDLLRRSVNDATLTGAGDRAPQIATFSVTR